MNLCFTIFVLSLTFWGIVFGEEKSNSIFFAGEALVLSETNHVEYMKTHAKGIFPITRTNEEIKRDKNRRFFIHLGNKAGISDILTVWVSKETGKVQGWRINTKIGTGRWFPEKPILSSDGIAALNRCRIVVGISNRYGDGSASEIFVSQFSWLTPLPVSNE